MEIHLSVTEYKINGSLYFNITLIHSQPFSKWRDSLTLLVMLTGSYV